MMNNTKVSHSDSEKNMIRLDLREPKNLITFTWENINVYAKKKASCLAKMTGKAKEEAIHIVKNVNGIAKPGELMAIMGASGAGKTTLMNVLTFRNRGSLDISGQIELNGKVVKDSRELAAISGYVQQDDIFIGTLKVKEHLKFQAMLRLPSSADHEEKMERVEQCLNDLNLKKCEDTLIGAPQLGVKGISGGERRRLAFASEIITNPSILFCDEPTSGLDAFMAMSIVESMKNLANQGKTIICTIHQPSSEIFEMFDRLYLMAEGRLAYTGSLVDAIRFFSSQGFTCPSNYNPADFYIKKLAIMPNDRDKCKESVKKICEGFEKSSYNADLNSEIKNAFANKDDSLDAYLARLDEDQNGVLKTYKSNSFVQLRWLLWRSFLSTSRNPMETKITFIQTIFIAIMFGLIFLRQIYNQEGVQNINGVLFLFITNNSFSNMFPVINTFPAEIPIFLNEHHAGMYRVINYYFSKVLSELPRFLLIPFLFVVIAYWMCNLNPDVNRFFICCFTIIFIANVTISFASFLSAISPSVNIALAISGPILVPLMIFSGFFLNNNTVPVYFIWLKYLSWLNYSNEILLVNQWDGVTDIECRTNATICFKTGNQILEYYNIDKSQYLPNFAWLGCLYVGWRIMAFLVLLFKSYTKK